MMQEKLFKVPELFDRKIFFCVEILIVENFFIRRNFFMDTKEIFIKISEMLEKFGIKDALKNQTVVDTIYNVMTQHGMKVDKMMFNLVVMGIATTPADKLGDIITLVGNFMASGAQNSQGGANPLAAILGAATQGQQQNQSTNQNENPLAALGALGALAGALGGAAQGQQQQQQNQSPTAADLLGGLAKALNQK